MHIFIYLSYPCFNALFSIWLPIKTLMTPFTFSGAKVKCFFSSIRGSDLTVVSLPKLMLLPSKNHRIWATVALSNVPFRARALLGMHLEVYLCSAAFGFLKIERFVWRWWKLPDNSSLQKCAVPPKATHMHLSAAFFFSSQFVLIAIMAGSSFTVKRGSVAEEGEVYWSMFWVNLLTPWHLYHIYHMCQNRGEEEQREVTYPSWLHTVEHVYLIFLSLSCLGSNGWQMCCCLWNLCGLLHKMVLFFSAIHFYANIYLECLIANSLNRQAD